MSGPRNSNFGINYHTWKLSMTLGNLDNIIDQTILDVVYFAGCDNVYVYNYMYLLYIDQLSRVFLN